MMHTLDDRQSDHRPSESSIRLFVDQEPAERTDNTSDKFTTITGRCESDAVQRNTYDCGQQ